MEYPKNDVEIINEFIKENYSVKVVDSWKRVKAFLDNHDYSTIGDEMINDFCSPKNCKDCDGCDCFDDLENFENL